jgi:hypothetical protein
MDQRRRGSSVPGGLELVQDWWIFDEVVFLDLQPEDGRYEPLLGYVVHEKSRAAVDMVGHRLVPVKHLDLE